MCKHVLRNPLGIQYFGLDNVLMLKELLMLATEEEKSHSCGATPQGTSKWIRYINPPGPKIILLNP